MSLQTANWRQRRAQTFQARKQLSEPLQRAYERLYSPRTGFAGYNQELTEWPDSSPLRLWQVFVEDMSRYNDQCIDKGYSWRRGLGAAMTLHESTMAAIGEALERHAACFYSETEDILWASYNEIHTQAISPEQFALPSASDLNKSKNALRFDPDQRLDWTQAWLLPEGRSVYVPAGFVYVPYQPGTLASARLAPYISTGSAAGPDPGWAVMRGLCECIERDAFMITYLNRLPVPEIDLDTVKDPEFLNLLSHLPPWSRGQIRAWSTTTDIGIASILVIISSQEPLPAIICGSATHVNPVLALKKALIEAWQGLFGFTSYYFEEAAKHQYAADFSDVITRDDHLLLAGQPQYRAHLDWLLREREKISLDSLPDLSGGSPQQELARALAEVKHAGLAVLACDLTTYEAQQAGIHCCRVLVPGTQQLAFGPMQVECERLYEVPRRLGYTRERTTKESLNPVPHPFP